MYIYCIYVALLFSTGKLFCPFSILKNSTKIELSIGQEPTVLTFRHRELTCTMKHPLNYL